MYLLEIGDDYRVLVDCGLDLGRERALAEGRPVAVYEPAFPGSNFPFDASTLSAVLVTHAHIDHSGMLPNLIREGFQGEIICTAPTKDLIEILLQDSANLHRRKFKSNKGKQKRRQPVAEMAMAEGGAADQRMPDLSIGWYLQEHVEETMEYFRTVRFDHPFDLTEGVRVTFITSGHLLGAAHIYLEAREGNKTIRVGFSGDIGRFNAPLLPDPKPMPPVDYLICESTYGNRYHQDKADPVDVMEDVLYRTCVESPGRLIIPAFSIGRTQAILYTLNRLYSERGFSPIKVFSDSPMALASTKVYNRHAKELNGQTRQFQQQHGSLFDFDNFEFIADPEKSKSLSDYSEPSIIISSSGMIKGGRIEYHVRRNLENAYCTIMIVGYAPEGTLSHQLVNGLAMVRSDGKEYNVMARVEKTDVFSGHADLDGLLDFVGQQDKEKLRGIFLVHGDAEAMHDFAHTLGTKGYDQVYVPELGHSYELV